MLFNSIEFLMFLPVVFLLYWFVFKKLQAQNLFIVIVSYIFYGWWDWHFLLLIAITSIFSFTSGVLMDRGNSLLFKKLICATNIVLNLCILFVFKYLDFFAENFSLLLNSLGMEADWVTLDILLPVGISFYTFQALSYTIDVYRNKINPTYNIVAFTAFLSFFPQLVAGPIERATNLLPQFVSFPQNRTV